MALLNVVGSIPVVVCLDTDERTVLSVHAIDEAFEADHVVRASDELRVAGAAARKALEIVVDDTLMWPGWEWGW